jgi:DNA-binding NtrC family response regulator
MRNDTILVAETDTTVAACIAEVLAAEGYTVHRHPNNCVTVDVIERVQPDLVIVEQWRAYPDVTLLLDLLHQHATKSIAVIVSATNPETLRELTGSLGRRSCATLLKPFDIDQLLESVAGALDDRWRRQPVRAPEQQYA